MSMADLLLLHGALGGAAQLEPLRTAIRERITTHAFDFEGHGAGAVRERPFRIEHFAENVLDHLAGAGVERVSIFGYSMGGYVGIHLAATRPELVERVMTLGTKYQWTPEVAAREGRMLDPATIEAKVPHFARTLEARHTALGWTRVVDGTREMMTALGAQPLLGDETLRSVRQPVRIVVGDRDATVSVEESAATARLLQRGELEVLPATPHPIEKISIGRLVVAIADFFGPA
jgi:pimeloyl-ACP methyl ester carboxylesterase